MELYIELKEISCVNGGIIRLYQIIWKLLNLEESPSHTGNIYPSLTSQDSTFYALVKGLMVCNVCVIHIQYNQKLVLENVFAWFRFATKFVNI